MNQVNEILGLLAQTSIHAGTGQNTGVIDLPIQREGHNGYPCVFGSSMKGALRTKAETRYPHDAQGNPAPGVAAVFGPDTGNASAHAGALMVSDARLLLLPIRSLTSQFKWVTCPEILGRFQRDAERFGQATAFSPEKLAVEGEDAWVFSKQEAGDLFLEEYRFKAVAHVSEQKDFEKVIDALALLMQRADAKSVLEKQLVIVSNDMFTHLAHYATPVNAHIAIQSETKTVRDGALWYEETLPPETLLYTGLSAVKARNGDATMDATKIMATITGLFEGEPWLQVGGNETVGMGWCAVKALSGGR